MSHALRHGECLPNPSRVQAARWTSAVALSMHLRTRVCKKAYKINPEQALT